MILDTSSLSDRQATGPGLGCSLCPHHYQMRPCCTPEALDDDLPPTLQGLAPPGTWPTAPCTPWVPASSGGPCRLLGTCCREWRLSGASPFSRWALCRHCALELQQGALELLPTIGLPACH